MCTVVILHYHKPLKRILGAHREVPKMVANRLQCWALTLSAYDYELKVVQGKENVVADFLSRLPVDSTMHLLLKGKGNLRCC